MSVREDVTPDPLTSPPPRAESGYASLREAMAAILRLVSTQLGARSVFLVLLAPDEAYGEVVGAHELPGGCGIREGARVALVALPDTRRDPSFPPQPDGGLAVRIGSLYAASVVLAGGGGSGVLCAADPEPRALRPEQVELLPTLARVIATRYERDRELDRLRATEEALRRSEERYRTLATASAQLVWTADAAGTITSDIPAWSAYTGQSEWQIRERGWLDAIHPDDRADTEATWARADAARAAYETEYRVRRRDGAYRCLLERAVPVLEPDGAVREWVGACTDVTERREAEERVRRSEERFRTLFRSDVLGIIITRLEGPIREANDAFLRLVGYDRVALDSGRLDWAALTPPEHRARDREAVAELSASGVATPWEKEYVRRDGTRVPVLVGGALLGEGAEEIVAFVADLTELKRAQAQREELLGRVREALALRDTFISLAAHELKTPLTSLRGATYLLRRELAPHGAPEGADVSPRIRLLDLADRQVRRIERLVVELLDVTRIQTGELEIERAPFDLADAVRETVRDFRQTAMETPFHLHAPDIGPRVAGDRGRVQQVLTNLLDNATKYSRSGGAVEVVLDQEGGRAVVSVRDMGIGIPEGEQSRVFDLYFRATNAPASHYSGLGLGLHVSRSIIERHGGELWFGSREGEGSVFRFSLPIEELDP